MSFTKNDYIYFIALVLAIWFVITAWIWTYYVALFIGYPAGIVSLLLWRTGRKNDVKKERYKIILTILSIGLLLSLGVLVTLLITN